MTDNDPSLVSSPGDETAETNTLSESASFLSAEKAAHPVKNGVLPSSSAGVQKVEEKETKKEDQGDAVMLKRELGLFSAVGLIVSVMIGSGIFVSPASVLEKSGSVGLCLIVWASCGLISYLGALAFAELGTVVPTSGAEYAYFQAAFTAHPRLHPFVGPLPAFIFIWVIVLLVRPAEVAILVLAFSEYLYSPIVQALGLYLSPWREFLVKKLIALLAISLITFINIMSVKLFIKIQNVISCLKILACLCVIGGGLYGLGSGYTENISRGFEGTRSNVKDLVFAFFNGLWAFDGWTSVTVVTEEIKNPNRNIPMSISIGVPLITSLYFMMNVAYMTILSYSEIVSAPAVATAFAEKLFGPVAVLVPLAVALSSFGCGLSVQFGVSRLCFAAGRAGHMLQAFSFIHVKRLTPAPAVILQGSLSFIFILLGNINELIEFVSFLIWLFYGLAMIALLVMRKTKADVPRPYKVPTVIPVFILFIAISLAAIPLVLSPAIQYLGAVAFILLGTLVYYICVYKSHHPSFMDKVTRCIQKLCQVVPTDVREAEPREELAQKCDEC
ncbi:amino acid transporter [Nesidiocoris tenuis]|uniref:Amino acid transporter n=1 Tax=Nesidiocoris tenuis TaxID=355587 RepID=A0ABN7BGT5_9HEMI|nr:amino acid transporter [Nesidiocoris tenuis]